MAPRVVAHPEARPTEESEVTVDTTEFSVTERVISSAGDPFFAAAPSLGYLAELTPSKRDKLIREAAATEYRAHLRRLMAMGVTDDEDDE